MENKKLKVAILTGDEIRHRYFATILSQVLDVLLVVYEQKANVHKKMSFGDIGDKVISDHFTSRIIIEEKYFKQHPNGRFEKVVEVHTGGANNEEVINELQDAQVEYILLFGSSLIKNNILDAFPNRIINLHLGLSPYYRGSGTNFWPLVDGLPECVGSTIHLAVKAIDAGGILKQIRPDITLGDSPHDIGNKAILAAIKILPHVLLEYKKGQIVPHKQNLKSGKLCLRKHLSAESIIQFYKNFEHGMIEEYLDHQKERLAKYPILD